ncbi:MAG: GNAT family N-acetyltransferase [Actinobacteria bacterium]|nr:GNAT family N-acetyltransferase [Actinomycetota bacterium]
MKVRDLEEGDSIAGHPFDAVYLGRARQSGMYLALAAGADGHLYGGTEAGLLLHTTRGIAMRTRSVVGAAQTYKPLLGELRDRAAALGCVALYLTSSPHLPELCTAASSLKFERVRDPFGKNELPMRRVRAPVGNVASRGVTVRPMRVDEYPDVRERILPLVSGGGHVVPDSMLRRFLESQAYIPYVAEIDGTVVGYAELATFHTALASCRVGRIERVAVVPEARGRHVSRAIVGELLAQSAKLDCQRVDLQVRDGNVPAVRTYERLGFVRTDEILYYLAL